MNPLSHWNRDITPDFEAVVDGLDTATTAAAVFDNRDAAEAFVKACVKADLGLSVNISTSIDGAEQLLRSRPASPVTASAIRSVSRARPSICRTPTC